MRGGKGQLMRPSALTQCHLHTHVTLQGGWTALHYAARNGHVTAMALLLDRGADPSATDCVRREEEERERSGGGREGGAVLKWSCGLLMGKSW